MNSWEVTHGSAYLKNRRFIDECAFQFYLLIPEGEVWICDASVDIASYECLDYGGLEQVWLSVAKH